MLLCILMIALCVVFLDSFDITWFERVSMIAILLNCVTLGMYQPCADEICASSRCRMLQVFDDFIFAFFAVEMLIKTVAMGITGKGAYMSDSWNRLDGFIVFAGALEYCLDVGNINLSAIRTIRVLRPLRAINRIPSMRILVMLLLDTLPMLGNVLLLCFFVFFIFGIVGVQLWAGLLRQRCYIELPKNVSYPENVPPFYHDPDDDDSEYICSLDKDSGMHRCAGLPPYQWQGRTCNSSAAPFSSNTPSEGSCVDWNQYYLLCRAGNRNPFKGAISFDNIGLAWVAIFLVISLEGWSDIMYYVQDAHSFWDWVYFVLLIVIGSFFMINLCLVVIATQFSETKKREMERMRLERSTMNSSSSVASNSFSEPTGCYNEIVKYLAHLTRCGKRRFILWYKHRRKRRKAGSIHLRSRRTPSQQQNQPYQQRRSGSWSSGGCRRPSGTNGVHPVMPAVLQVPFAESPQAPCASPEVSDVDLMGSPRRPHHPSFSGSDCVFSTDSSVPEGGLESRRRSSSRRASRLTCAQLLALSGTQGAALAASCNFSVHRLCTGGRGEKHMSAPTLIFYYPEGGEEGIEGEEDSDLDDLSFLKGFGSSVCCRWWKPKQAKLKRIVDHRYFQRGILTAILVNTLSMGIEYHNQPDELTFIVEVSNLVFTGIFGFEMCLKILAEGLYGYISSGYNVFDGVIVILSIVELCHSSGSGLSVLRTFRLLRILKLVRFLPALRRQLVIMLRTVDNVAVFFALLMLFIFIFSILGMNLFGCKFCEKSEDNSDCDRKNFDSLLWAIVTVFQILTQEDWNIVLFNGMERTSHWAALYFVALMTFGNYVLFNLLVAILVEGFSAEDERKRSDESINNEEEHEQVKNTPRKESHSSRHGHHHHHHRRSSGGEVVSPPIITHTAATPQGSPNNTLMPLMKDLKDRLTPLMAFTVPGQSFESIDRTSTAMSLSHDSSSPSSRSQRTSIGSEILMYVPNYTVPTQDCTSGNKTVCVPCREGMTFPDEDYPKVKLKEDCEDLMSMEGSIQYAEALKSLHQTKSANRHRQCNGGVPVLRGGTLVLKDTEVRLRDSSPQYSLRSHDSRPPLSPQSSLASGSLPTPEPPEAPKRYECKNDNCVINEKICWIIEPKGWIKKRENFSVFLFPPTNKFRRICNRIAAKKAFDYGVLFFISLNCITLAMERPTIPPGSIERTILAAANYVFTVVFAIEMFIKVIARGLWYGDRAYFKSGWNVMDGSLVIISLVDFCLSFIADGSPRIFGILRVFRLLRSLRPLRVINRAPGLKLVVQTLLSSLRPIGNIVLICCTFFIIFGILGVQLFKGSLYYCEGPDIRNVKNRTDCEDDPRNQWVNQRYNFDNLGQALMSLFVLSSKDGWVNIMYTGLDAVGVDQQPIVNYNEWRLLYFISFLLLVAFFVLNMFVGVVVENFHRCREEQEKEEKALRAAKRAKKIEKKRRKMREPPYYINYSKPRLLTHNIITSKYFDLAIAAVIGLNVVTMATEFYMMPMELVYALKVFNYFFTAVFILEAAMKIVALGLKRYLSDRWNQLDVGIVILSVIGIVLEEMESEVIPINPTIIRVMRVLRIARVLKLLKMAKGIRALLDTVMQALPQVGNLGLLFFLLFFIFAALGVELFGRLECTDDYPCQGLGEHAHFRNFGMAFLTLFRVATGDNWNGIMKDTLRENCDPSSDCVRNCCVSPVIAPLYFVVFVLMAQFVLVNVVVAVLMKHLEESHKHMDDDMEMDAEIERQLAAEIADSVRRKGREKRREVRKQEEQKQSAHRKLIKMSSLPSNFVFRFSDDINDKNTSGVDRTNGAHYSPLATISVHNDDEGTSPTLSWPATSGGRRHTLDTTKETQPLSPVPLIGSLAHSPAKPRPIRMISGESSDDASAPSVTVIAVENLNAGEIVIEEVGCNDDQLSVCDVALLSDDDEEHSRDGDMVWYVEEEESGTSTNGLLRNYPELRSQPGLDTMSWTASDEFSSTTLSGTLSGADPLPVASLPQPSSLSQSSSVRMLEMDDEDPKCTLSQSSSLRLLGVTDEHETDTSIPGKSIITPQSSSSLSIIDFDQMGGDSEQNPNMSDPSSTSITMLDDIGYDEPTNNPKASSSYRSGSMRIMGLDDVDEAMEDILVVDPNDQTAVLVLGTRPCSEMPTRDGHCLMKPDQC